MPPPRHRARQGLPRPQHQRLSAAAGPLLSRLYRRRHVRPRHLRQGEPEADLAVDNSPPYTGFMHTVVPLFDRGLMLVTDESTENNAKDWPKLIWVLDARDETNLVPISTCPLPDHQALRGRGGRFGAHNIHENVPLPTSWQSDQIVLGTFFNGGLRAYDISNPYQPKEVGVFVPPAPPMATHAARSSSTTCSSTSARSSTRSTATSAGCTSWRWISDHAACSAVVPMTAEQKTWRRIARSLSLARGRPVRAPAQARARRQDPGHGRHRLPRRRQDHAGAPLPGDAGGRRHRRRHQRVRQRRHRRRAGARLDRRDHAARQRLPLLQHPLRPADRAAQPGGRSRARQGAARSSAS